MIRGLKCLSFLLVLVSSASHAQLYDVANKTYDFTGVSVGSAVAYCGLFAKSLAPPVARENTLSITFGVSEEIGGLLQMFDDNLLAAGRVVDAQITNRKRNKLILQHAGTISPLESGNELRDKIANKLKAEPVNGVEYTGEPTVRSYSNKIYLKKDFLKMVETIIVSAPAYPQRGCTTRFIAKRKLFGVIHVDPPPV